MEKKIEFILTSIVCLIFLSCLLIIVFLDSFLFAKIFCLICAVIFTIEYIVELKNYRKSKKELSSDVENEDKF